MTAITRVEAWEVLDSRGDPTVRAAVEAGEARGVFTVSAGASTGSHEASSGVTAGTGTAAAACARPSRPSRGNSRPSYADGT